MTKSHEMETSLNNMTDKFFGTRRTWAYCVFCKSWEVERKDFRDHQSFTEFEISSLCQKCQDEVFGEKD